MSNKSSYPSAVRRLVHRIFPLTASADDESSLGTVSDLEGHLAAPPRLLVALQLHVSGADVSFVQARRYLMHPKQRDSIAASLSGENCVEFLECLGDVAESTAGSGISDVEALCLNLANLADTEPFSTRAKSRPSFFSIRVEDVAFRAITSIVRATAPGNETEIAAEVATNPQGLTVAMELFAGSYLYNTRDSEKLYCAPEDKERLESELAENVLQAARAARLLTTCNPGFILSRLAIAKPSVCPNVFSAMKSLDPSLDGFVLAMCAYSYDSANGQIYSLPEDHTRIEAYCSIEKLKSHAKERLKQNPQLPALAAWRAIDEDKSIYGVDGTYARD
jgi:hypothetical protein